jgi:hypothetical protein
MKQQVQATVRSNMQIKATQFISTKQQLLRSQRAVALGSKLQHEDMRAVSIGADVTDQLKRK